MTTYNDSLSRYISEAFAVEDDALRQVREMIPKKGLPEIMVRPEEGRFLQWLARAAGARRAVEIGTLGGYSGIWIARGLVGDGKLLTIEMSARHAEVAREHFQLAGVSARVEIQVGDAHQLLPKMPGPFDFVFVDAEKSGYPAYLEWAAKSLRPGGVLAAHNVFRHGAIVDGIDENTVAMRAFLRALADDSRWLATVYPGGDGMAVAVRV